MTDSEHDMIIDDHAPFLPAKPARRWGFPLLIGALLAAGGTLYYFTSLRPEPAPTPPAPVAAPQPAAPATAEAPPVEHPIAAPAAPEPAPLPALAESDPALSEALAGVLGNSFRQLFEPQDLVRRLVATIDNLPRKTLAQRLLPIKPVPGPFRAVGPEGALVVSPDNAARYTPYVRALEAVNSASLVAIYVRFYPLFQQAYAELGYPTHYFNDRLFEVIDNLLATPDVSGAIALTQPKVLYEYADPALQDLSAGQKMLLRMGPDNEARVKAKLREIKRALTRGL